MSSAEVAAALRSFSSLHARVRAEGIEGPLCVWARAGADAPWTLSCTDLSSWWELTVTPSATLDHIKTLRVAGDTPAEYFARVRRAFESSTLVGALEPSLSVTLTVPGAPESTPHTYELAAVDDGPDGIRSRVHASVVGAAGKRRGGLVRKPGMSLVNPSAKRFRAAGAKIVDSADD
eukprot:m51a1_g726 hypothetical protein (177) ;mRNA; r:464995-465935